MSYRLGIDVGSTRTSATLVREGTLHAFQIDRRTAAVSSASLAPEAWRECTDGLTPEAMAEAVAEVVERARRIEGEPEAIAATYPATWNSREVARLRSALYDQGLEGVGLLSAPRAAAAAAVEQERVAVGDLLAVFDVGVRATTITVLRVAEESRFAQLAVMACPALSGRHVDEAVYGHLLDCLSVVAGPEIEELLDPSHPEFAASMHALGSACSAAKERLAQEDATSIDVDIPGLQTRVRITREELSKRLMKPLSAGRVALREALKAANTELGEVAAVLIVGGTTRLPIFATVVCEQFGPEAQAKRDIDPILAIAAGASMALCRIEAPAAEEEAPAAERQPSRLMARLGGAMGHRAPGAPRRVSPVR
ncbi:MAG: Hsp70 family protein [Sporichthyaceae bacterium]